MLEVTTKLSVKLVRPQHTMVRKQCKAILMRKTVALAKKIMPQYVYRISSNNKDESKVFLKIRRNGLAKFRDPHGWRRGENCDILKI